MMKTVLVTGASSGIGEATVERLCAVGWRVFAGYRALAAVAPTELAAARSAELFPNSRSSAGDGDADPAAAAEGEVVPIQLDVTDAADIAAAVIAQRTGGSLDAVVHSAGIAVGGALERVDPDELREILDVNVVGTIAVSQPLLPMLRRAGGRILLVGSVGGKVAFPFAGPYHATKFALEAVADSLRAELKPQGVGVALIEPAVIDTAIWAKAREQVAAQREELDPEGRELYDARLESFQERLSSAESKGESPAKVADKIIDALEGGGSRYPVGRGAGTLTQLRPLLPDFAFDRLASALSK